MAPREASHLKPAHQPPPHHHQERRRAAAGDLDKPFVTVLRPDPATGQPTPVVLPTGSVRASLGSLSTFEDVYALAAFLRRYLE